MQRDGAGNYAALADEVIDLVYLIPNHDDDGSPNPAIVGRQVTGVLVTGTAGGSQRRAVGNLPPEAYEVLADSLGDFRRVGDKDRPDKEKATDTGTTDRKDGSRSDKDR